MTTYVTTVFLVEFGRGIWKFLSTALQGNSTIHGLTIVQAWTDRDKIPFQDL